MGLYFGGLRKKVLKNFIIIIILIVFIFEVFFAIFTTRYYYTSIRQSMLSQMRYIDTVYNATNMTNIDFNDRVRSILENQNNMQNSNIAINIINSRGKLIIDQYGFNSNKILNYVDVKKALKNTSGTDMGTYIYKGSSPLHIFTYEITPAWNSCLSKPLYFSIVYLSHFTIFY